MFRVHEHSRQSSQLYQPYPDPCQQLPVCNLWKGKDKTKLTTRSIVLIFQFWESEKHLRKHEKIHERTLANSIVVETNENGLFKCSECPKVYIQRTLCVSHMHRFHGIKPYKIQTEPTPPEGAETSSNKCPECSKTFTNPVAYDQHMRRHRNVSEGRFKCKECGQASNSTGLPSCEY